MNNTLSLTLAAIVAMAAPMSALANDAVECNVRNTQTVATTPATDFEFHDDGTITHLRTGLMWTQCLVGETYSNGACFGSPQGSSFETALNYAQESDYAGYTDWRLPNIKEAMSLIERQCAMPAMNLAVFPSMASLDRLITSTTSHGNSRTVRLHTEAGAVLTLTSGTTTNFLMVREPE
ncbi:MAG: DUF1566 domain-containing protein [Aliidiomarina sp.]|uniref:Lcl C-terminal domain-containing protein n=1 Tax=Aliidiomarina sp. TaxID=1872439 RepID=UPI0025BA1CDA|nr:DUF1566 domain-containing protein [Aliidiomarina sp.]MCH8500865.1 DUF1566 domain-containing protein [Aliidiomarina sp.]